ncbi:Signal recognition particle SEC65 subunit [Penicillium lagena]|uniref:Signal recognition particle SEC65 subunit n=1 Tax=Penicillium lagena TaxID=94218 RepID=UPI00254212AD|nr:Signal recognition particle SEC65 subunit [Penicillium lagena]KAJ5625251.1 Signal recognition particle SEC65 subunit [Penicillium lagena]
MPQHARVEEVDSDPDEVAPSDFDVGDAIIAPANIPSRAPANPTPPNMANMANMANAANEAQMAEPQREIPKHFQCLYPVYFDKTRSRAEGRKVGAELAVENPLARDIADAVQMLGLQVGLEPEKLHPKDWANPGRHHLYILVAQYLKAHPTNEQSPYRLRIRGLPVPDKLPDAPSAPRGWKIGKILPIHSPAYSGGGVSDNPLQDAMAEMQSMGGMPGMPAIPGMPGMMDMGGPSGPGGGAEKKKKEKKKGKA